MNNRINLRIKMMLIFLTLFVLNAIFLVIFVYNFLPSGIRSEVLSLRHYVNDEMNKYIQTLSNSDDIVTGCKDLKVSDGMYIVVKDIDNTLIYSYPDKNSVDELINSDKYFYKDSSSFFITNNDVGRQMYFMNAYSYVSSYSQITYDLIIKMCITECLMTIILFLVYLLLIKRYFIKPIYNLSNVVNSYNSSNNITDIIYTDEIEQLSYDFKSLIDALKSEQEKQNRMIASISHDIKTPLTSILGYTEQLKKENITDERRKKYTDTIYSKSLAIKGMVENLDDYLVFNTIDKSEKKKVSINYIFNVLNSYYEDDLKRANVSFKIKNQCPNAFVNVNESSIIRVFGNLIDNSLKHKRSNEKLSLLITCKEKGSYILFSFSDNGIGVSKKHLSKIFEPFYTTDESRNRAVSGLGLSICQEIVQDHEGEIWATESSSHGLCVSFTLKKEKDK
ncbi:MAG: HAMP domain-containing histidine kinase [Clostridia bacterium]|nr:HAMP domain-containing histidine kinase [Clostridia bacterium]